MTSQVNVLKDLFCGCCSGWGQVLTMMPFENIKIKVVSKPQEYHGYTHAIKKTISEQGYLSFYKGMLMPLLGVGLQVSVQFGIVETLKKIIKKNFGNQDGTLDSKYSFLSGAIAGVPSGLILTPLDHARFRVTINKQIKPEGSVKTAINIYKKYGLSKVFLGVKPTVLRQAIGLSMYFGIYDNIMSNYRKNGQVSLIASLFAGGFSGACCWMSIYPLDYVKTLIQCDSLQNPKYKSATACAIHQFKNNPIKTFFRGFQIMIARAFVVNAFGFLCFEIAKKGVYEKN